MSRFSDVQCAFCEEVFELSEGHDCKYELLKKQNKRYREALEFYADENIYTEMKDQSGVLTVIEDEKGKKARKALYGE